MGLSAKKVVLHAAVEATYGILAVLAAANTIVTSGLEIMPLEGDTVSRDIDRPNFGADQALHVGIHGKIKFKTELVSSGVLGTVPKWEILALASKIKTTIVASTSVELTPDSEGTTSLTMEFNLDGQRHRLLGAKGDCELMFDSQNLPYLEWTFTGLFVDPSSAVALARNSTGWPAPRPVTFQDTPTVEFYGITTGWSLKSFKLSVGNKVEYFNNPGEESVDITDRESKGSIELLARDLTTFNAFTVAKNNTLGSMKIVHGTVAENRVIIESNVVQLLKPKYGNDRDRSTLQADLSFVPSDAGDDDWKIRMAAA
ncbi:MAG: phage tail tube protein [Burkholderiaceae bacterium]